MYPQRLLLVSTSCFSHQELPLPWSWPLSALTNWNVGGNASETSGAQVFKGWTNYTLSSSSNSCPQSPSSKLSHQAREAQAVLSSQLNGNWRAALTALGEIAAQPAIRTVSFDAPAALRPQMTAAPVNHKREKPTRFFLATSRILRIKRLVFQVTIF